jgi:hypothetical protein
MYTGTPQ